MGVPIIFGFIPVGIAFAIAARGAGFSILETCLMSLSVFAGASQMMAVGMYAEAAGIAAIIIATLVINLRHVIMSTCVMQRMDRGVPLYQRLLLSFGITDETFAVFTGSGERHTSPAFFLGLSLVAYSSWNVGTLMGALGADLLPDILTLAFGVALYAMFISMLTPGLRGNLRLAILVILTALFNSGLSMLIDATWALVISTLLGAAVGVFFVDLPGDGSDGERKERNGAANEMTGSEAASDKTRGDRVENDEIKEGDTDAQA